MGASMLFIGSWGPGSGDVGGFENVERELRTSDGMRIRLRPGQGVRTVHRPNGVVETYVGTRAELRKYEPRFQAMERGEE